MSNVSSWIVNHIKLSRSLKEIFTANMLQIEFELTKICLTTSSFWMSWTIFLLTTVEHIATLWCFQSVFCISVKLSWPSPRWSLRASEMNNCKSKIKRRHKERTKKANESKDHNKTFWDSTKHIKVHKSHQIATPEMSITVASSGRSRKDKDKNFWEILRDTQRWDMVRHEAWVCHLLITLQHVCGAWDGVGGEESLALPLQRKTWIKKNQQKESSYEHIRHKFILFQPSAFFVSGLKSLQAH